MAIALTAYLNMSLADCQTRLTAVQAEISRQLVAGGQFSALNRSRAGVNFETLSQMEAALQYAVAVKGGTLPDETVADLSRTGP